MAFLQVQFLSQTLAQGCSMNVILPEAHHRAPGSSQGFKAPYPVLYLLHGASDDHSAWQRYTSIERYASERGLAVVMPAVQYSFYSNMKAGYDYFTYVSEELPRIVQSMFPVSDKREDTFAIGLSMGGYGAFKLGITCPDKFAAVASLSGSLDQRWRLSDKTTFFNPMIHRMAKLTFGSYEEYIEGDDNLLRLLEQRIAGGVELPKFYHACGTADFNYELGREFKDAFEGRIDLTYEEEPGAEHVWPFWDKYVQRAMAWLPLRQYEGA
ncbi:alpha/beta hydrolase [Paenibacillus protaetiae]|uniref:Esterase family protein n=1 Tax=Paenibacillus protaetiae TaxID=2509456 RepID=A0A4P6F1W8_9BACL|nr:alpha/beta hydrolase family protein [Paenibacillus protaetiae]QAY67057.1 esterase family protein [Paenibacillus protaetiae]